MAELIATVAQASTWLARSAAPPRDWSPVYRALIPEASVPSPPVPTGDATELIHHQFTARALLVVAVTSGDRTRRVRIALDRAQATVESSDGDGPSRWSRAAIRELPGLIGDLLPGDGADHPPARLTVDRAAEGLRLTPEHDAAARAALGRGASPEEAFAAVPDLDERLLDALTAPGPRISVSLTLHDPAREVAEKPVAFSRLWVTGRRGLYRADSPGALGASGGAVRAVSPGDVLGTVLPLLEQGLRFTTACTTQGGAR